MNSKIFVECILVRSKTHEKNVAHNGFVVATFLYGFYKEKMN